MNLIFRNIFMIFSCLLLHFLFSSFENPTSNLNEIITKNQEYIKHHIQDSHDLIFFSDEKNNYHYGISLPVLFWDNGLIYFSSSEFAHGESVVEKNKNFYKLFHGKIYKTDETGDLKLDKFHHPHVPKILLDFSITKTVLALFIASILMCIFFITLARSYKIKDTPIGFGRFLEPMIIYIRDEIAKPNIGLSKYRNFIGYLLTLFFFILFLNLIGLLPFGFNATGNIVITFFLACFTYLVAQFSGNSEYWKCIFWMPGVPIVMKIILIPIELLGTITKPFALMIRLFANIIAGHIVIMTLISMMYLFPKVIAIPSFSFLTLFIYLLEVLVAFLQAYVFTVLTSLFIGMAVEGHHYDSHH